MSRLDDIERIRAVSESDAKLFEKTEVLTRAFAVATLITVPVAIWALVTGTHAVATVQVVITAIVAPLGFAISAWLRRRVARKHGLLAVLLLAFFTPPAPAARSALEYTPVRQACGASLPCVCELAVLERLPRQSRLRS